MAELRTLIPAMGIRPAARKLGVNEDTACVWAHRYGWTDDPEIKAALDLVPRPHLMPKDATCATSAKAIAQAMASDAVGGRAAALRLSRRKLEALESYDDEELLLPELVDAAHKTTKDAALSGGWGANDRPVAVRLSFGLDHAKTIDVEAEVQSVDPEQLT